MGSIEVEVRGEIEINGETYKIAEVPSADEYKGFPPSWEFVRTHMLNWRPYFRGKMVEINGQLIPSIGNYLLNMDEEMYELTLRIYQTFKLNKPPIETNISVVITDQIGEIERKIGRTLSAEEKTAYYIRLAVELAILRDIGLIN